MLTINGFTDDTARIPVAFQTITEIDSVTTWRLVSELLHSTDQTDEITEVRVWDNGVCTHEITREEYDAGDWWATVVEFWTPVLDLV